MSGPCMAIITFQFVPSGLVKVREVEQPQALDFYNFLPLVELTANTATGVSVDTGEKLRKQVAEEVCKVLGLSAEYRLAWLPRVVLIGTSNAYYHPG